MSSDLDALYRRWLFEVWGGDYDVAREILAEHFVGHWPTDDVEGPEGVISAVGAVRDLFEEIDVGLQVGPLVAGDFVAARWTFKAVYRGGVPGARAAPGTRTVHHGADFFRAEGDRFAEYWVSADNLELYQQLGVG